MVARPRSAVQPERARRRLKSEPPADDHMGMKELLSSLTDAVIAVGIVVAVPLAALQQTLPAFVFLGVLAGAALLRFATATRG
jgi:hypothetical protein